MTTDVLKDWNEAILNCYDMIGTNPDTGAAINRVSYRFEDQYMVIRD
jgi:hypothetical protein